MEFEHDSTQPLPTFSDREWAIYLQLWHWVDESDFWKLEKVFQEWDLLDNEEDADPDSRDRYEADLLARACWTGDFAIVMYLLTERRADATISAMEHCIERKSWTIARFLVINRFDIDQPVGDTGISVLGGVLDDRDKVLGLLKIGADPNMTRANGTCSIATLAAAHASLEVVKILNEAGTDFGRSNVFPRAVLSNDPERIQVMEYLLDNHLSDIHQVEHSYMRDNEVMIGRGTALHLAIGMNLIENVKFLLSKGADRSAVDPDGNTPWQLAENLDHREIMQELKAKKRRKLLKNPFACTYKY
ncbi:hypothetical protein ACHAPU_007521 [Fusarium lateritium]